MGIATPIGVVGSRYQVFQNGEVFSALDSIIDSGQARYSAAGEYDDGAKVWMLLQLPDTMEIKGDPHAAFILAKTSHDGSSSVVIRPVIERLWCANQINKIYRGKNKLTYTLRHTSNAQLIPKEIANIMQLTHTNMEMYSDLSITLMEREVSREFAVDYFKKVFPLPTAIEFAPIELLSKGEKSCEHVRWQQEVSHSIFTTSLLLRRISVEISLDCGNLLLNTQTTTVKVTLLNEQSLLLKEEAMA
jgi:hypothetical protein